MHLVTSQCFFIFKQKFTKLQGQLNINVMIIIDMLVITQLGDNVNLCVYEQQTQEVLTCVCGMLGALKRIPMS